jgi:DNA modification methylase
MQELEHWPLSRLIEYARNPRKNDHAVDKVAAAIREFGFRVPIVAKSDGTIIDGHLRFKAARRLALDTVPVLLADDMTPEQIKAFRISVNKVAELAEWDDELLALELSELREADFDLNLIGFDEDELDNLLKSMGEESGELLGDEDEVPEAPIQPVTVLGDTWLLGRHRVRCGDSTSITEVEQLMNGEKVDMVFTDPPYGMFFESERSNLTRSDHSGWVSTPKNYKNVIGDHQDFSPSLIQAIFSVSSDAKEVFIWGADYFAELLPSKNDGSWICWDKRSEGALDTMMGSMFELCWSKVKHKRKIARIKWIGFYGTEQEHDKKRLHPTQKPTALAEWFFEEWGDGLKIVLDLYGGSGSTLIACEKTGRSARLMELDPQYCDVIVKRWQTLTGKQATLESTGKTFAEVEGERK